MGQELADKYPARALFLMKRIRALGFSIFRKCALQAAKEELKKTANTQPRF